MTHCPFCHHPLRLVHVHGHYQCSVCGTNALPCCDGDNCDTNLLLKAQPVVQAKEPMEVSSTAPTTAGKTRWTALRLPQQYP